MNKWSAENRMFVTTDMQGGAELVQRWKGGKGDGKLHPLNRASWRLYLELPFNV